MRYAGFHFEIFFKALIIAAVLLLLLVLSTVTPSIAQRQTDTQSLQLQQLGQIEVLPIRAKRFAVIIGVDKYEDTQITTLGGATNDARAIADALVRYAGFPADQVILLASDQPAERQPTRGNILRRLSNLRRAAPRDGMLLVSFAGHGIEREGHAFLLPADAQVSGDIRLIEETTINVTRMKEAIRDTGIGQVVLILDACRNDPVGRASADNPLTPAYTRGFDFDVRNKEVLAFVTLYATVVGQRAYEFKEKRQGYFSWELVEALKGGAANEKGEVTLASLVRYLQENVPKRVRIDLGKEQLPFAVVEGYKAEELVISVADPNISLKTKTPLTTQPIDPAIMELGYWETIKKSTNPEDFKAYLKRYPGGTFVELALNRIKNLEKSANSKSPSSRGMKSEKVLVMSWIQMPGGVYEVSDMRIALFTAPFFQSLVGKGLSVTDGADRKFSISESNRLKSMIEKLIAGDTAAGSTIPFALAVYVNITVTTLEPYNGLYVTEANGKIEAIDTNDGKVVAFERISRVRGFGNTLEQSKGEVLKKAGEGISESFIDLVAKHAH